MALTATATESVQREILVKLRMTAHARRWIMSFERENLRFSVDRRESMDQVGGTRRVSMDYRWGMTLCML